MKKIGILGGLGPEASNKFCELLIKHKHVQEDQDHIPFIHYCNTKIPNRINYISGKNTRNPVPEMINSCKVLEKMGVDCIIIPCNTIHTLLPEIQEKISIPIINIIRLLVKSIKLNNPFIRKIGVLGTTLTIELKLYERYLNLVGIDVIRLNLKDQEKLVMRSIYDIKGGQKKEPKKLLIEASNRLTDLGAEALIMGCTEIPLVLKQKDISIDIYDPMENCAKEIIKFMEKTDPQEISEKKFPILREVEISKMNINE